MLIVPAICRKYTDMHRTGGVDYVESIEADFKTIEPHLPAKVESIIDIGCGMAGIDVLLVEHYPNAILRLIDADGIEPMYGWNGECMPYGNRLATETLLAENGTQFYEWIEPGTPYELRADLIISLLSWGFHYPLSTYNVRGFCIADLRNGYEPVRGKVIFEAQKFMRCAFVEGKPT